ncbi:hypothetical protein ACI797_03805 [Geodermatophilus sp. SYSU D00691]
MSAPSAGTAAPPGVLADRLARTSPRRRRQLLRAVSAEWVKARSLPSTWTALGTFLGIMVVLAVAIPLTRDVGSLPPSERARIEPVAEALSGVFMGQVALALLGALLVTAEFSSRAITVSGLAVPQRGMLLAAKALLLLALAVPAALLATTVGAAAGLGILRGQGLPVGLTGAGVPRAVVGAAVYLVLVALLGLAVGTLLRSTAAAVVLLTGALFLLPVLVGLLPASIAETVGPFLPSQAGQAAIQLYRRPGYLAPSTGLLVLAAYTAVLLAAAVRAIRGRDL